jgi:hypothetical protein
MRAGDGRSVVDVPVQVRGWVARCLKHGLDERRAQTCGGGGVISSGQKQKATENDVPCVRCPSTRSMCLFNSSYSASRSNLFT